MLIAYSRIIDQGKIAKLWAMFVKFYIFVAYTMAEYQYYEFRTINRVLSREQQREVNTWSSRGNVTPTSASFVYHYSDFRQNLETCLIGYFDMMLYVSNFGNKRLMFCFPEALVDFDALSHYAWNNQNDHEREITIYKKSQYIIVDIDENSDGGSDDWVEGEGVLPTLTPLWTEIVNGNYACLYLLWMSFAATQQEIMEEDDEQEDEDEEEDETPPPIPAGLHKPSASLREFMDFWAIPDDLRVAAAKSSPTETEIKPADLEKMVDQLSPAEKTNFLVRLLRDEPQVRLALVKHLESLAGKPPVAKSTISIHKLVETQSEVAEAREKREKAEAAEKRRMELEAMKKGEPSMWNTVQANLLKKTARGYEDAVAMLRDLRDLADYTEQRTAFDAKVLNIIEKFGRSKAFMDRLIKAGL